MLICGLNQFKCWCYFSVAVRLCDQRPRDNHTLMQSTLSVASLIINLISFIQNCEVETHHMGHQELKHEKQTLQRLGYNEHTTNILIRIVGLAHKRNGGDDDADGQTGGQEARGKRVVCQTRRRRGGCWLMSSLTCNAVLGCITQSSSSCQWRGRARGWRQPRRVLGQTERKRGREREEKWARQSASAVVLQDSACSRASTFLLFFLFFLPCTLLPAVLLPFLLFSSVCHPLPLQSQLFSHQHGSLSLLLFHSTFHYLFFSLFSFGSQSLFFFSTWRMEWEVFFFFLTPALSPVLFPCITSHGHPCILQVRAGCVCVCVCVWGSVGRLDSYRQLEVVLRQLQVFWSAPEVLEVSCFQFMSVDQGTLIWVFMCRSGKKTNKLAFVILRGIDISLSCCTKCVNALVRFKIFSHSPSTILSVYLCSLHNANWQ